MYPERHISLAIDLKVAQTLCYTSSYSEIDGMGENHVFLKVFIKLHTFGQPLLTPLYLPRTHFLPWVSLAWQHARLRWPGAAPPAWTAGWRASPSASVPPRVQSLCLAGTGTQSMWSGNEKKSHFFFLMCNPVKQKQIFAEYLSSAEAGYISVYPWNPKLALLVEKVKSEIRKDTVLEPPPPHSAGCSPRFPKAQGKCLEENSAHCWEPRVFQRIPKSPLEPLGCCLPGCLTTPECHNFMSSNPSWNLCHAARRGQRRLWCRMGSALHRHLLSPHLSPVPQPAWRPGSLRTAENHPPCSFSLFLCPSVPLLLPPVNLDYQSGSRLNFAAISSD